MGNILVSNYIARKELYMESKKVLYDQSRCKGCHYCLNFCPQKAISKSGHTNENGYETIVIDNEKCIACGICYTMCPDYALTVIREN